MYFTAEVQDTIRVPPHRFDEELGDVLVEIARESFEGQIDTDLGFLLAVTSVNEVGRGRLIPGDGAAYYDCTFDVLSYLPEQGEIIEGEVVEATDFGVFVRVGPIDALCHVSQIADDFFSYNDRSGELRGKQSNRVLKVGEKVRARIIAVNIGKTSVRVGITMRQSILGSFAWVESWRKSILEPNKEGEG